MSATARKFRAPSIAAVASELKGYKVWLDVENPEADIRLQVTDGGCWAVHFGDSSYDQDHRGYWGASSIDRRTNCRELARELIDQCADHFYQCQ